VEPRKANSLRQQPLDGFLSFIGQVFKNYRHTGALMPSSPVLARAMTRSLRKATRPKRLLEVGPGTGPFTRFILEALRPGDELDIVEINPIFARRLEDMLLRPFRKAHPNITIRMHCQPIESAEISGTFDYIVCGLPFNNFPPKLVRTIFRRLIGMLSEGGELAYFEYAGVRVVKGTLVGPEGRKRLRRISQMGKVLHRRHAGRRELILGNVPPAVAVRLVR
jgi:phosphatidylethanolamine/phosphatidyl-N-methylethanolamine N-methyltransferase